MTYFLAEQLRVRETSKKKRRPVPTGIQSTPSDCWHGVACTCPSHLSVAQLEPDPVWGYRTTNTQLNCCLLNYCLELLTVVEVTHIMPEILY
jgi:hypothetical protein